jgi:uncharacterized protein DUF4160
MPNISYFYGIIIRIYFREHPPPHFHALYGEYVAQIDISTGRVIEGGAAAPRFGSGTQMA